MQKIQVIRINGQTVEAVITGNSVEAPWLFTARVYDDPQAVDIFAPGEAIAVTCDSGTYYEIETATA
uniref:Uncharacterized protein n=1 Tax=viral metagenome TaxID=1070528 RepID=A0A6H1ZAP0_9ZZZZ